MNWYCLRTAPEKEFTAEQILTRAGFTAFVPFVIEYRRQNRYSVRKVEVRRPLMVRYLFLGYENHEVPWLHLFTKCQGVLQAALARNGAPWCFPEEEIGDLMLKSSAKAPYLWRFMRTHKEFNVGDDVRVVEGPWKDHPEAYHVPVQEIDRGVARLFLTVFGRRMLVDIPLNMLEKAS